MPFRPDTYELANKVEEYEIWERAYDHIDGGGGKSIFIYTSDVGIARSEALKRAHSLRQRLYHYRKALQVQQPEEWSRFRLYVLSVVDNDKYTGVRIGDLPTTDALRIVGE